VTPLPARFRLLALLVLATLAVSACGRAFAPPAAVVHGSTISDADLREAIPLFRFFTALRQQPCGTAAYKGESTSAACSRFALSQLITEELVGAYATQHDVSVARTEVLNAIIPLEQQLGGRAALQQQLAHQHLEFSDLRLLTTRLLLIQKVAQDVAKGQVSDRELRQRYQQESLQFTILDAAHILVHNEAAAVKIRAQATPQNFADLARRYSKDPGSGPKGGDLGPTPASQLDQTFVQAALALKPGEISQPVHTQFGWHLIRLISTKVEPFEQARSQLVAEFAGQAFTDWLAKESRSDVDVNPRYGRFDPKKEEVLPVRCTAETPSPSCKA
jgi:parvulin-like peptidyl-prolyl isomerase